MGSPWTSRWHPAGGAEHWLLASLGVEPLSDAFTGAYLKRAARRRQVAVKNFLMDGRVVVGVGNIYANEALFRAGIRPTLRAARVTLASYERLALAVKSVLRQAIDMGGTTLRDFVNQDGQPGYFRQSLFVYGREAQPCRSCGTVLKGLRIGQRHQDESNGHTHLGHHHPAPTPPQPRRDEAVHHRSPQKFQRISRANQGQETDLGQRNIFNGCPGLQSA